MSNVLNFDVYKNTLQRTDGLPPVSSERNYSDIVCHFKDEDWGGIGVLSAGFYVTEKQVYSVVSSMLPSVDDESTDCYTAAFKIPTVLVGNRNPIYFGICKSFSENNEVVKTIATNVVAIDVARGVVIPSDLTPAEEASLYEQLLAAVGAVLDAKADKSYVDDELDLKADAATTYTKSETDGLLDQKADNATTLAGYGITDAYTKTDVESALAGKADVNHTHSQYLTEHQDISGKADIADIPTKTSQLQNDSGFLTAHQDISGKVNFVEVVRNDVTKNEVDSCLSENTIYHVYLRTAVVSYDWAMVCVLKTSQFIIQYALTTSEYVIFRRAAISNGVIGTWNSWDFIPNHTKTNELINDAIAGKANIADVPTKTSDLTNDSGFLTSHQDISGKADKSNTVFYQELIGAHSGITNIDQLANDSKTIYRVIIGENSGLLFNINTNQKNFQYILMNNGDVLQRSKQLNTEWNNKEFTSIIPDISGKADVADIPTKVSDLQNDSGFLTEHQSLSDYYTKAKTQNIIDLSVYSKLRLDNGKLIYTDDDIPYDLGDAKNVFYTKTEIDTALSGKESAGNKVTSISSSSTDAQYPSAKAVYNKIGDEIGRTIDYTFSTSGSGLISGLTVEAGKNGDYYLTFYDSSYHPHHLFNLSSILPDISGKANIADIPTKTSQLTNDSGFLTSHQSLSNYYTKSETDTALGGKANASHTHSQYLTQHQDVSGKADKSDTYTKAQVDAMLLEAGGANVVNSISDMTDTSRLYVLASSGHIYRYTSVTVDPPNELSVAQYNKYVSGSSGIAGASENGVFISQPIPIDLTVNSCTLTLKNFASVLVLGDYSKVSALDSSNNLLGNLLLGNSNGSNVVPCTTSGDDYVVDATVIATKLLNNGKISDKSQIKAIVLSPQISSNAISASDIENLGFYISTHGGTTSQWTDTGIVYGGGNEQALTALDTRLDAAEDNIAELAAAGSEAAVIPSFWQSEVEDTVGKIKALQEAGGHNLLCFGWCSDMHVPVNGTDYEKNLGAVAARVMKECDIPLFLVTGDLLTGDTGTALADIPSAYEKAWTYLNPIGTEKILAVKGNHDAWTGNNGSGVYYVKGLPPEKLHNLIYRPQEKDFRRVFGSDGSYYYVDDIPQKTRFICLNSHWANYEENQDGTAKYSTQKGAGFGQAQLDWLIDALQVDNGYSVVVALHTPPSKQLPNGVNYLDNEHARDMTIMRGILTAYCGKTTYSGSYTHSDKGTYLQEGTWADVSISCNFSNYHGTLLGLFCGHTHYDQYVSDGIGAPIVCITSAINTPYDTSASVRVQGTSAETVMDFVCINRSTGAINLIRCGYGSDRQI